MKALIDQPIYIYQALHIIKNQCDKHGVKVQFTISPHRHNVVCRFEGNVVSSRVFTPAITDKRFIIQLANNGIRVAKYGKESRHKLKVGE